jgi:hypothetical protein
MNMKILRLCAFLLIGPAFAGDAKMVVVTGKDMKGEVFKRLGLPSQAYCWEQCLADARCTGTRWAEIVHATESASTAGQCQLLSGALTFTEPRELRTEDGQRIRVTASRREGSEN